MSWPKPRCSFCGRFTSYDADQSTNFGGVEDTEPPDADLYCTACASRSEEEAVTQHFLPSHWIPAAWEWRAAKRLGFVRAGPSGAAWGGWWASDKVPSNYVVYREGAR